MRAGAKLDMQGPIDFRRVGAPTEMGIFNANAIFRMLMICLIMYKSKQYHLQNTEKKKKKKIVSISLDGAPWKLGPIDLVTPVSRVV